MKITYPEIDGAPGCFGSAFTYDPRLDGCQACMFASECAPRSRKRLIMLREHMGLPALVTGSARKKAKPPKIPSSRTPE